MKFLKTLTVNWLPHVALAISLTATQAQTFSIVKSFVAGNTTGIHPYSGLAQAPDGTLYGTNPEADGTTAGTLYSLRPDGSGFRVLKLFTNSIEGAAPYGTPAVSGGVLYGVTSSGGYANNGTVFKVNTDGSGYTVLKSFLGSDGANPYVGVIVSEGVIYGMTSDGGAGELQYGTLFKMNIDGTGFAVLKDFDASGSFPAGPLTLVSNVLYGTSYGSAGAGLGIVYKINTDGTGYQVLKLFPGINTPDISGDGALPSSGVIYSEGVLYGTTTEGGSLYGGTVYKLNTDGSGYKILKNFDKYGSEGSYPEGALTISGTNLYGTCSESPGTVYKVNTDGTGFSVLTTESGDSFSTLILSSGTLYGTSYNGGAGYGAVFRVDLTPPTLNIQHLGNSVVLTWNRPGYSLQSAPSSTSVFTNVLGATSPFTNSCAAGAAFFRLIGN